jgi:hypothetical protein
MLKVKNSDQLGDLTGERRARPAAPPAPVSSMPVVPQVDVSKLAQAVLEIAAQQRDSNAAILRAIQQRPRTMEADILRDEAGRATRIVITVTSDE